MRLLRQRAHLPGKLLLSIMRKSKILEQYNNELLLFVAAKEHDWVNAASQLFGLNCMKEVSDYLQQLQLLKKVKEKLP